MLLRRNHADQGGRLVSDDKEGCKIKKIAVIYYSGSGGTKTIADLLLQQLASLHDVVSFEAHFNDPDMDFSQFDLFVFGFPVFFLRPVPAMVQFLSRLPVFISPKPAVVFITKTCISGNAIRLFAKELRKNNVVLCGSIELRAPSTDLSLVFSYKLSKMLYHMKSSIIFGYEKKTTAKITRLISIANSILMTGRIKAKAPHLKWYRPLFWPIQRRMNGLADKRYDLRILADRCNRCQLCLQLCRASAWRLEGDVFRHYPEYCEFCLGCVHHCPRMAIVFSDAMKDNPRLDAKFHAWARERYLSGG